jgi:hypothetical protein
MKTKRRASQILAAGAAVGVVILTSPAAFAGTNGPLATSGGSSAKWFHSGDYFHLCDTRSDGDPVYVEFSYSGSGGEIRLNWSGGADTCVDRTYNVGEGKTVRYHTCVDDTFNDTCSVYKEGVA